MTAPSYPSHRRPRFLKACSVLALAGACSSQSGSAAPGDGGSSGTKQYDAARHASGQGSGEGGGTGTGSSDDSGLASSSGSGSARGTGSGSSGTAKPDATGASCLGSSFLAALGKDHLLVGVSGSDTAEGAAPYDLRYTYISGGTLYELDAVHGLRLVVFELVVGLLQYAARHVRDRLRFGGHSASPAQIPMFTYYELLQTAQATLSGFQEGTAEVTEAATNAGIMTRYYNDWRFLLQRVGQTRAIFHIEPDFWGYVRQAGDPTTLPAVVSAANSTDCSGLPSTIAGLGQCMIAMVRKYAPHSLVGLQASAWNIVGNTSASMDVTPDAKEVATVLAACGQKSGDFVVVETSDRDAGYYQVTESKDTWWDPTDKTLPNFAQDLTWIKALTEALGVPALYWQTPLGNSAQNNTTNHYKDNRVDYFFGGSASQVESGPAVTVPAHWSDLAAAHVVGVAFGAGASGPTNPDTDGGRLAADTKAYISSGGQPLCP